MSVILKLENIVKRFGHFVALKNINLEVQKGEFLSIIGPSGSGKTTLVRLLVGMDEVSEGAIWLNEERIEDVPADKRPTCMVFQSLALFPHKTVGENIEFPLKIKGVDPQIRKARAMELLALLRLPQDYYEKRIQQCSGGERQRVALARALAFDPEILFFDEPLSALDYRLRKTLEKELKNIHEKTGKTFIYITHSLEEAMGMSDRIAIMKDGRFEQIAVADEIYTSPASTFVAEFMGEVNIFDIDNGTIDEVKISPAVSKKMAKSGKLIVRPENVNFLGRSTKTDFSATVQVLADFNLGSRFQYEVVLPSGAKMTIETQRDKRFAGKMNQKVNIGWNYDEVHVITEGH